MSSKTAMGIFVMLGLITFYAGNKMVGSVERKIEYTEKDIMELESKRRMLWQFEKVLTAEKDKLQAIQTLETTDDFVAKAVATDLVESWLKIAGLNGQVITKNARYSQDFPSILGVKEVEVLVGVRDYTSYVSLVNFMDYLSKGSFFVEGLYMGSAAPANLDVGGIFKLYLKFYVLAEG